MKMIHEMRERRVFEQQKSSSPLPIIIGAVIAFGIGMLGVSGIVRAPALFQSKTQTVQVTPRDATPEVSVDTSGRRIGRAETAPLLKTCMSLQKFGIGGFGKDMPIEAGDLYRILQTGSTAMSIASMAGAKPDAMGTAGFATMWADVADCIYRQNGWMICDPDNRALAVEAAITLVRQASAAVKSAKTPDSDFAKTVATIQGKNAPQREYMVQSANAAKARVLSGLRTYVADGRLTSSDFGLFAPSEITQVIRDTKVTRDACATRN
jgi:hypothetical protein